MPAPPAIAATDAPTAGYSIVYTPDGVFEQVLAFRANPDLVLVDSEVITQAGVRFLVSGMGDTLATRFEA